MSRVDSRFLLAYLLYRDHINFDYNAYRGKKRYFSCSSLSIAGRAYANTKHTGI